MNNNPITKKYFLEPGYVCLPYEAMHLASVIASGVAVTIFDPENNRGGMCVYTHPKRINNQSIPSFAAPSIISLVSMFGENKEAYKNLEAHICGGAIDEESDYYIPGLSEDNISVGKEILTKYNIDITSQDVGGKKARKVVFHTGTGEIVVAKVSTVRKTDWYPPFDPVERKKRETER